MERNQWYKPNLLYNIHYRPQKQDSPELIVETRIFNPSVCTCGKHGCDPHYRMERIVVWSSKAEENALKMRREASKQEPEDGHNYDIGNEDDCADGEKEVANVSVKRVIGGIDEQCSGDIVNADCGKRNSVDGMDNGDCGTGGGRRNTVDCNGECSGNGISGEIEICNGSIDHGSIGNDPGDRSCIGNGEDRSGRGDDGCVDCIVGDNSCGNDGGGQLHRQLQADDSIKSTGPLHITSIAPPQLDSIPTEKANVTAKDLTIEHLGTFPKCSQLKTKTRYSKVKFYCTEQVNEADEKRIVQEAEDTLQRYITVKEATSIQKEMKSIGNGVTKRKSIGARVRGVLSNLFCCKSRRAATVD